MLKMLARTEEAARSLFALMFPMFVGASPARDDFSPRRWVARSVLFSILLGLLWRLNQAEWLGLKGWIPFGLIGEAWIPLFALTLYALVWTGWSLYLFFSRGAEAPSLEFGDIDDAWDQAIKALAKGGISLDETPVFLVLGWTSDSEETFFRATGLRLSVKQVPDRPDAPLRVTANRDGIWITCSGASALGQFRTSVADQARSPLGSLVEDPAFDANATFAAGSDATFGIMDILQGKKIEDFLGGVPVAASREFDLGLARDRLRHLCRLIVRDRGVLCPINGILVLLPITVTERKTVVAQVATACRADLAVVHETFRIRCPAVFLVCDLDDLSGFSELVERLPAGQVNGRRGQRFPLVPDLKPDQVPAKVKESIEWIAETYFPAMVYTSFQVETPGGESLADVLRANSRMFLFMSEMRSLDEGLANLVKDCLPTLEGEPMMFGGCYFAGTGDAPNRRAFASGVLMRLIDDQDKVTWAEEYLGEDASYHRQIGIAKLVFNSFIAILGVATAFFIFGLLT